MAKVKAPLNFDRVKCARCGAHRVLEQPCADCGAAPGSGETNAPVVRRRQACRLVDESVEPENENPSSSDVQSVVDQVTGWPERFVASLGALIRSPGGESASQMASTLGELRDIQARLAPNAKLRPVALARATAEVANELSGLWPLYREALTTSHLGRAQELSETAQSVLDNAAVALVEAHVIGRAVDVLREEADVPSLIDRIMMSLDIRHGGLALNEYAALGRDRAKEASTVSVTDANGIDFLSAELLADAYLDGDAFRSKVRECSVRLAESARKAEIACVPGALEDLASARREVFEAAKHCMYVLDVETDQAAVFRRISRTVGELYEAAGPLWAWGGVLLSKSLQGPSYQTARARNSTANVRKITESIPLTAGDAPQYLRNAASHRGSITLDVNTETVHISLESYTETMTLGDYLDRVLALIESVLALNWSLGNMLAADGLDVPIDDEDANYFGLTKVDMARFWLERERGYTAVTIHLDQGIWVADAAMPEADVFPTGVVLALASGHNVTEVRLRSKGSTGPAVEFALSDWLDHSAAYETADEVLKPVLLAELHSKMRQGGSPLLARGQLITALVSVALPVLRGEAVEVASLRRVKSLAEACGWADLSEFAVRVMRVVRAGEPEQVIRDLQPLVAQMQTAGEIATDAVIVRIGHHGAMV